MRCLVIDNYDSFTWNLVDYVTQLVRVPPVVVRNDEHSWEELEAMGPFSCIIVSPGPGSVTNLDDFNVSRDALERATVPVLGVCLGHQGLAHVHGARIEHAPVPFHGRISTVHHDGSALFDGIPRAFDAVRYHSLVVSPESVPEELVVTAWSECGLVMGLRHCERPQWGVQFHPESILTAHGKRLVGNFLAGVERRSGRTKAPRRGRVNARQPGLGPARKLPTSPLRNTRTPRTRHALARKLETTADAEEVFVTLYGDHPRSFWLDSQGTKGSCSEFTFMGTAEEALVLPGASADASRHLAALERELEGYTIHSERELPFEFRGGYVGYMTYEMKAAFGAATSHANSMPDSLWMRVDRFIAFDHVSGAVWLVALAKPGRHHEARAWMDEVERRLMSLSGDLPAIRSPGLDSLEVSMNFARSEYLAAIEACKRKIVDGESYEVCLTNTFSMDQQLDPLALYRVMRRGNPAPFGAFLRFGEHRVLSTSPERFLEVDASGVVQTKPMKGTCARSSDPAIDRRNARSLAASEKDRAENLMIVDLMRNDLARISIPGTVTVPRLLNIESFATVHQMVSTVESRLEPTLGLVDLLRAVFPGGSITGAPKIRTMEILDKLERSPRGVYCGSIGYLGYGRVADLNIAIRTLSYDGVTMKLGAGGAITHLSDPDGEFDEVLLKASALLRPIWTYFCGDGVPFERRLDGRSLHLTRRRRERRRESRNLASRYEEAQHGRDHA